MKELIFAAATLVLLVNAETPDRNYPVQLSTNDRIVCGVNPVPYTVAVPANTVMDFTIAAGDYLYGNVLFAPAYKGKHVHLTGKDRLVCGVNPTAYAVTSSTQTLLDYTASGTTAANLMFKEMEQ